jgi:hypothetical protein
MKLVKTVLIASTILAQVSLAYAQGSVAVMSSASGKVLINKGKGFHAAAGLVSLNVGDTVMVGKDSSAVISYNSGCSIDAAASSVVTVAAKAPCAAGQASITEDGAFITPVADMDPGMGASPAAFGLPLPLLLLGVAAPVAGVLVFTDILGNGNGAPPPVSVLVN